VLPEAWKAHVKIHLLPLVLPNSEEMEHGKSVAYTMLLSIWHAPQQFFNAIETVVYSVLETIEKSNLQNITRIALTITALQQ